MLFLTNCEGRSGATLCRRLLESGASALDAVEQAVRAVEADTAIHSVGRGGHPRLDGQVECDAAVMDGATLQTGAVGALKGFRHPVSVARKVMERLPHVLLVGDGAARFAREVAAEEAEMLTDAALTTHQRWLEANVPAEELKRWPDVPLARHAWRAGETLDTADTVIYLALDRQGRMAGAASTSGWARSYPGRIGDSPVIGAGLYVDGRYGAAGCTHIGEMTIRAGTARSVVLYLKTGLKLHDACAEAIRDLGRLQGGYLGNVVVHALDAGGSPCVLATADLQEKSTWLYWREGMVETELRPAEVLPLPRQENQA
ncbi:MAG: isoaspartyl peptidase/L-asparaginase [candidate division WOR-3 bacterium]